MDKTSELVAEFLSAHSITKCPEGSAMQSVDAEKRRAQALGEFLGSAGHGIRSNLGKKHGAANVYRTRQIETKAIQRAGLVTKHKRDLA